MPARSPLTDLFLQDQLPSGFSFVPDTVQVNGTPFPAADPQLGFGLPDVRGGETITVSFQAKADALPVPNPAWNRADLRYAYTPVEGGIPIPFPVSTNEVPVLVLEAADLAVEKTAAPDPVDPGAPLTYTITISNAGPSPARDVTLTTPFPPEPGEESIERKLISMADIISGPLAEPKDRRGLLRPEYSLDGRPVMAALDWVPIHWGPGRGENGLRFSCGGW